MLLGRPKAHGLRPVGFNGDVEQSQLSSANLDDDHRNRVDPRDLKYCRNRCPCYWDPADDPFRWRDRLPFARWGLAELQLMGWPLLALTILWADWYPYVAPVPAALVCLIAYFFRDPLRRVPAEPGLLVAPADGQVG